MSRGSTKSWKSGWNYCTAKNRDGRDCGNLVPKGIRLCSTHRRQAERRKRAGS